jgi:hypothetical protein
MNGVRIHSNAEWVQRDGSCDERDAANDVRRLGRWDEMRDECSDEFVEDSFPSGRKCSATAQLFDHADRDDELQHVTKRRNDDCCATDDER